ncbi:MAG: hypothetical protein ACI93N_000003 [Flavobacteriaceae bacterium]|jgi:hypothetical protein
MLIIIQKHKLTKFISAFIAVNFLVELFIPTVAFALTGGPSQPEVQSFEPVTSSEMVDVFTGDFNYNIPLMDVDGYPINIAYHSGINMEQQASWVGLGWNINPGAIVRGMRGLPDDFNGDEVKKTFFMKDNITYGAKFGLGLEIIGVGDFLKNYLSFSLGASLGAFHNNYKGVGFEHGTDVSFKLSAPVKGAQLGISGSIGKNYNSQTGTDYSASYTGSIGAKGGSMSFGESANLNSRTGIVNSSKSFKASYTYTFKNLEYANNYGANTNVSSSIGVGVNLPMNNQFSYTPQITTEFNNVSRNYRLTIGTEFWTLHGHGYVEGYMSKQEVSKPDKEKVSPAFGYMYSENNNQIDSALLDFNRENDGKYFRTKPNLPTSTITYDSYMVSGQGVSGSYRPYRGDVGTVYDAKAKNETDGKSKGIEVGFGLYFRAGYNTTTTNATAKSGGRWSDNSELDKLKFRKKIDGNLYEPVYFKQAGEKTLIDEDFYESFGGVEAMRFGLTKGKLNGTFNLDGGGAKNIPNDNQRSKREKRSQVITFLTAKEAKDFALEEFLPVGINRTDGYREEHHLSEVTVLKATGERYVYGIPAYNKVQKEYTFSVHHTADITDGLVYYEPSPLSSPPPPIIPPIVDKKTVVPLNEKGYDEYYSKTELPAYAHSYLLTAVLSPDYVDLKGDGITDDDYGTAVKLNYAKHTSTYKWRIPYNRYRAMHHKGYRSLPKDDKGSVTYGEKEIWYLKSVETKNHIAEFNTSFRQDGLGVEDADGGKPVSPVDSDKLKRLDNIKLSVKKGTTIGTLIKTVHFKYNYSLCSGVPNSTSGAGKLTLDHIYFTYGDSEKSRLNKYKFTYDTNNNPDYDSKGFDRWGTYKPSTGTINNIDFPYTEQNKAATDLRAAAWSLKEIELPSGGVIEVDYESDDYAYIQDKKATQMVILKGVSNPTSNSPSSSLFSSFSTLNAPGDYTKVYLDLGTYITPTNSILDEMLGDLDKLYFKCLVDITSKGDEEYISGYAVIKGHGIDQAGEAYVLIENVKLDDKHSTKVNPISKASWNYTRLNLPNFAYPGSDTYASNGSEVKILRALAGAFHEFASNTFGINVMFKAKKFGKTFTPAKSWVRLNTPFGHKLGGGARVSSLRIKDGWSSMVGASYGTEKSYGKLYEYELEDGTSSGVAAYEPALGNDENALKVPIALKSVERMLVPDDENYIERPFGEAFYPAPSVGYSRVVVKDIKDAAVNRHATGWEEYEYYTAKDFPVINKETNLEVYQFPKEFSVKGFWTLKTKSKDYLSNSQGYSIINNDMHGKPKAKWTYAEGQVAALSGIEYKYKTKDLDGDGIQDGNILDNKVSLITPDGVNEEGIVGIETDIIADVRESDNDMKVKQTQYNLDVVPFPSPFFPFPVPIPSRFKTETKELTRYQSAVITKVSTQYGILEEVIAYKNGSSISVKNLAYDSETGEVLVTRTTNEFNDEEYNLTYPAHWAYAGMSGAYKNIGVEFNERIEYLNSNPSTYGVTNASQFFTPGDEVIVALDNGLSEWYKYWVTEVIDNNASIFDYIKLENKSGSSLVGTHIDSLKVIRSGYRNMQSTPIGGVTLKENPLTTYFNQSNPEPLTKVLQANATEFNDKWPVYCLNDSSIFLNPYLSGARGNWRAKYAYVYDSDRVNSSNIREDGTFSQFTPFWEKGTFNWTKDATDWLWTSKVTKYTPYGNEVENKDPLGRYSAALYGFNHSLVEAVASNAKHNQIAVEHAEDFAYSSLKNHAYFGGTKYNDKSHTGLSSIRIYWGEFGIDFNTEDSCNNQNNFTSALIQAQGNNMTQNQSVNVSQASYLPLLNQQINNYSPTSMGSQAIAQNIASGLGPGSNSNINPLNTQVMANISNGNTNSYQNDDCDCISNFSPTRGQKYIISAWVSGSGTNSFKLSLSTLDYSSASTVNIEYPEIGNLIEGWSRIYWVFTIPQDAVSGNLSFLNQASSGTSSSDLYIDDIRIHPFGSSMKTYVYNPDNFRLSAILDENNYATFYEYDKEGLLVRTKKETEKGIYIIQENRQHFSVTN